MGTQLKNESIISQKLLSLHPPFPFRVNSKIWHFYVMRMLEQTSRDLCNVNTHPLHQVLPFLASPLRSVISGPCSSGREGTHTPSGLPRPRAGDAAPDHPVRPGAGLQAEPG